MSFYADCAREWFACAYDLFDRVPGPFAREARDRVWSVSESIGDGASMEECERACETVREIVRGLYVTTDRLTAAIAVLWRDYVADGVAEDFEFTTPADGARYARDVLTLPGHRGVIGGYPIDYDGSESAIAFVTVVAASDAAISEALAGAVRVFEWEDGFTPYGAQLDGDTLTEYQGFGLSGPGVAVERRSTVTRRPEWDGHPKAADYVMSDDFSAGDVDGEDAVWIDGLGYSLTPLA